MIDFVLAATLILGLAACAALLLRGRAREARRLALLAGIVTTLLVPLAAQLAGALGLSASAGPHGLASAAIATVASQLHHTLVGVWLCGAAAMAARLIWQAFLTVRVVKHSRPLGPDETSIVMRTLPVSSGEVACRFRIADAIETPLVVAGNLQTVLLPGVWTHWSAPLQASALRHEWRHVCGADAQWSVLAALLRVVLWFHPLAWWICARWAEECEHLADHAAAHGRVAAEYAEDLLLLATAVRADRVPFATAFVPNQGSRLERRLRAILDDSTRFLPCSRAARLLLVCAFAAAGIMLAVVLAPRPHIVAGELAAEARTRLLANPFPADP